MSVQILGNVLDIPGVSGAVIFDADGICVEHDLRPPYEPILLDSVRRRLESTMNYIRSLEDAAEAHLFVGRFEQGSLFVRWQGQYAIVLMATPEVNVSMLTVGLNATALRLGSSSPAQSSAMAGSATGSGSSFSPSGQSLSPPPGAIGMPVVKRLIRTLARRTGPVAKLIVKRELQRLGTTAWTLMPDQYGDLVALCARSLPVESQRSEFIADANRLLVQN